MDAIKIKPSHEGELHKELGVPDDKNIAKSKLSAALKNASPKMEKQIVFAENAKKWNH